MVRLRGEFNRALLSFALIALLAACDSDFSALKKSAAVASSSSSSSSSGSSSPVVDVISSGWNHVCATMNGSARCWGLNTDGELGDGSTTESHVSVQVTGLTSGVTSITTGQVHSCAVHNGAAKCWGAEIGLGVLGDSGAAGVGSSVPVQVTGLTSGVTQIATKNGHTCALVGTDVWCWGANNFGQLGTGVTNASVDHPVQVTGLSSHVTAIGVGQDHSCAVDAGSLFCWGRNSNGQLGDNLVSGASSNVPVQVLGLTTGVTAVAAGQRHTCAIVNGGVQCFGLNSSGQLGDNTLVNSNVAVTALPAASGVTSISTGLNTSCAIVNGNAMCWGYNFYGQAGINTNGMANYQVAFPRDVIGLTTGVTALTAAGSASACGIANGIYYCWGLNTNGSVGDNSVVERDMAVAMTVNW